jgi:GNAT superfamily N-acetyltransferase
MTTVPDVMIRPLDVSSESDLAQLNALDEACDEALFGAHEVHTLQQRRAILADSPYATTHRWVAELEQMEGGRSIVGLAMVFLPLQENLDALDVGLAVHPAFRGQGVGTALVEQALRPAIDVSGRHLVTYWGEIPADGDVDDPTLPSNRIAARLGVARKNVGVCRVASLPLDATRLDELGAHAQEKLGDYRVELWEDTVPAEHLEGYGVLLRQLDLDDPDEEIEYEAADYPPERIRVIEERRAAAGTSALIAVAIAPDGSFVGNSEIHVQRSAGTTAAWQENTLVMPDHRGHRLGMAMKVATHRLLGERFPDLRVLATWNSHVNPWMIGINEQLGYRVAFREIGYQGRVGAVASGRVDRRLSVEE